MKAANLTNSDLMFENQQWWESDLWSKDDLHLDDVYPRILVVEDDPFTTKILTRVISQVHPKAVVDTVTTAEEAEDLLTTIENVGQDSPYDLFIVDIYLDGKGTGIEVLNVCRTLYPEVPFVITSVADRQTFEELAARCPNMVPAFLPKPFAPSQCRELIAKYIRDARDDRGSET